MNLFRFIADMLHLAAILLLLYRIRKVRNCIGKSIQPVCSPAFPEPKMPASIFAMYAL